MRTIILFLDGVGLGRDDTATNPLAAADMPTLSSLLDGRRLLAGNGRIETAAATLIPTDAGLGVPGRPQSATGQTALLTGLNAPALLGEHYGPRPNAPLREILNGETLFSRALAAGHKVCYANAFPQGYFGAVKRGKRLHGAIPHAAAAAGLRLRSADDLRRGQALSVDFTNAGWRNSLGYDDMPLREPAEAGGLLAQLASDADLTWFEHWPTDILGHRGQLDAAIDIFQQFDAFLRGLLAGIDLSETLVLITSDHGNVEDCSQRRHTENPVPTLLIGAPRQTIAANIHDLTHIAPAILQVTGTF